MSTDRYNEVLKAVHFLTLDEQQKLLEDLLRIIHTSSETRPPRSVLELEGLGAEIWEGVDVEDYINRERDSWEPWPKKKHTIMEFRGFAKGFWADVDMEAYIREERNSWDKEDNKD